MIFKDLIGKRIFVRLTDNTHYIGVVDSIDDYSIPNLTFITIIDKFGKFVTFNSSEIIKIVEEKYD